MEMSEAREGWLAAQMAVSAQRLVNLSPSLLSPTGRLLQEEVADWIGQCGAPVAQSQEEPHKARELKVVHRSSKPEVAVESQLPLISGVSLRKR